MSEKKRLAIQKEKEAREKARSLLRIRLKRFEVVKRKQERKREE